MRAAFRVGLLVAVLAASLLPLGGVGANPASTGSIVHVVQWGENLTLIAASYGTTVQAVAAANGIADPDLIYVGQQLVISGEAAGGEAPPPSGAMGREYVVQAGDTLSAVAWRYGIAVSSLTQANGIANPNLIYVGQRLVIPPGGSAPSEDDNQSGVHVVQAGETLTAIAARYGTTVWAIAVANSIANPSLIYVGQRLAIPGMSGGESQPTPTAAPSPPPPSGSAMATPEYGAHAFLWWSETTEARDLNLLTAASFGWVKQIFAWRDMEGAGKGHYDWSSADRVVNSCQWSGVQILARVDFQPAWARADGAENGPPDDYNDYGDFLFAMASRYQGRIRAYEIWNEPNLAREWGGQPPDARQYVELLKVAYTRIKQADPDALVLTAGLAPTTAWGSIAMPDVEFMRQMYAAGAKPYFDVLGVHAAGFKAPPEMSPDEVANDPNYNHGEPGAGRIYCFRHVEDIRQIMVDNGDGAKQMAILEFGWTSDPVHPEYSWHSVTEEQKADYLVRAYQWAGEHWAPWMGPMFLIYLADSGWTEADEQYWWCITNPDGSPRPAYEALRAMPK